MKEGKEREKEGREGGREGGRKGDTESRQTHFNMETLVAVYLMLGTTQRRPL